MHKKVPKTRDIFNIRGILLADEPMWRHTTFRVGGPADLFAVPEDEEDLRSLLPAADRHCDLFCLGGGSNLLVADEGIRGLVIDMKRFDDYRFDDDSDAGLTPRGAPDADEGVPGAGGADPGGDESGRRDRSLSRTEPGARRRLVLGAGLEISDAAWKSGAAGLAGLDVFFGMPGSVGGAVWMNARCYGGEIADSFAWADVMDRSGRISRLERSAGGWAYKASPFQESDGVILRAAFDLESAEAAALKESMTEKRNDREGKGHFRAPCAGSAFKNNRSFGEPSGALIDRCGLKGLRVGGAAVSDWHGNIVINDRGATAADIHELLARVADRVEETTGCRMEREIRTVGAWPGRK